MRSTAAERERRRRVAAAGLGYAAARLDRLEALLRDPASWRWMAVHFAELRDSLGDHADLAEWRDLSDRLHRDALDVLRLAGEALPEPTAGGPSTAPQRLQEPLRATAPPAPAPARLGRSARDRE